MSKPPPCTSIWTPTASDLANLTPPGCRSAAKEQKFNIQALMGILDGSAWVCFRDFFSGFKQINIWGRRWRKRAAKRDLVGGVWLTRATPLRRCLWVFAIPSSFASFFLVTFWVWLWGRSSLGHIGLAAAATEASVAYAMLKVSPSRICAGQSWRQTWVHGGWWDRGDESRVRFYQGIRNRAH